MLTAWFSPKKPQAETNVPPVVKTAENAGSAPHCGDLLPHPDFIVESALQPPTVKPWCPRRACGALRGLKGMASLPLLPAGGIPPARTVRLHEPARRSQIERPARTQRVTHAHAKEAGRFPRRARPAARKAQVDRVIVKAFPRQAGFVVRAIDPILPLLAAASPGRGGR
jgi:hypothetical protein